MSTGGEGLDVDDVTGCPLAPSCDACGVTSAAAAVLMVRTLATPVGVCCATLCAGCVCARRLPRFPSWAAAAAAVGAHCGHLGCDVDEMAAALAGPGGGA